MTESSIPIMLILGIATAITVYLVSSHRVEWWHAMLPWSAIVALLVCNFFGKSLRYHDPHIGVLPSVITEFILPHGLPSLIGILVGAGIGWFMAQWEMSRRNR